MLVPAAVRVAARADTLGTSTSTSQQLKTAEHGFTRNARRQFVSVPGFRHTASVEAGCNSRLLLFLPMIRYAMRGRYSRLGATTTASMVQPPKRTWDPLRVGLRFCKVMVCLGVITSSILGAMLFMTGVRLAVTNGWSAFVQGDAIALVTASVDALDRFLLGMVSFVFGLGSYELFISTRRAENYARPKWLKIESIDDLEQKIGEIVIAVMVVNLLQHSMSMPFTKPLDLVYGAICAMFAAAALFILHQASGKKNGNDAGKSKRGSAG